MPPCPLLLPNATRSALRASCVLLYIEQHLDDELSEVAHYSRFHFHRAFSAAA